MATLEDRLTLAAFNAATEGRGNVKLVWGSYVGTGTWGITTPNRLDFDGAPLWVIVRKDNAGTITDQIEMRRAMTIASACISSTTPMVRAAWGDNHVTWYAEDAEKQWNALSKSYYYIALVGM